jgi:hypothetical protein
MTKDIFDRLSAPAPRQLEDQQFDEPELIRRGPQPIIPLTHFKSDAPEIIRRGPQPIIPLPHFKSSPGEKLLSWIVNDWPNPVISLRDIRVYGPNCTRDPLNATSLTKILAEYGWLIPVKAWRRDRKTWKIVREPSKTLTRI